MSTALRVYAIVSLAIHVATLFFLRWVAGITALYWSGFQEGKPLPMLTVLFVQNASAAFWISIPLAVLLVYLIQARCTSRPLLHYTGGVLVLTVLLLILSLTASTLPLLH